MGLITSDGSPDPVGVMALCSIIGATLYDDLKNNLNAVKLYDLCDEFLVLRNCGDVSEMLGYLNMLYGLIGQKLPTQIGWAAINDALLHDVLFSLAQDFEEYLAEDGLLDTVRAKWSKDNYTFSMYGKGVQRKRRRSYKHNSK